MGSSVTHSFFHQTNQISVLSGPVQVLNGKFGCLALAPVRLLGRCWVMYALERLDLHTPRAGQMLISGSEGQPSKSSLLVVWGSQPPIELAHSSSHEHDFLKLSPWVKSLCVIMRTCSVSWPFQMVKWAVSLKGKVSYTPFHIFDLNSPGYNLLCLFQSCSAVYTKSYLVGACWDSNDHICYNLLQLQTLSVASSRSHPSSAHCLPFKKQGTFQTLACCASSGSAMFRLFFCCLVFFMPNLSTVFLSICVLSPFCSEPVLLPPAWL